MAAAAKNWETQAKTNSVLAAALKALDERLMELEKLQAWKEEMEGQIEEMTEEQVVLRKRLDTLRPDNNQALKKLRFGVSGKIAPEKLATEGDAKSTFQSQQSTAGKGLQSVNSRAIKFMDEKLPLSQLIAIKSRDYMSYLIALLQIALCGPLAYEIYNTEDTFTRGLAGLLGISSLISGLAILYGVRWMLKRPLTVALSFQIWLIVLGALYMETSSKEVQKIDKFCALPFVDVSDCAFRKETAYARTGYGAGSILMAIMGAIFITLQRDEVMVLEVSQHMSRRIKHLARGAPASGAHSRAASNMGSQMLGPSIYNAKSGQVFGALEGLAKSAKDGDQALLEGPPKAGALVSAGKSGNYGGSKKIMSVASIPEDSELSKAKSNAGEKVGTVKEEADES